MEKIINKIKGLDSILNDETQKVPKNVLTEILDAVRKFAIELEHEKAHAIIQLINESPNMEAIKFQRGRIYQIKRLQRDYLRD